MQLVLHAPFGSRINKAWGLALRKRFCRQFNFELQAAATEDALLLSLGPQHSFPARRRLPVSASGDGARRARAGVPRRAGLSDPLALEHHDLAGGAAQPQRPQGAAAAPAHAGRRPDGRGVSGRGGLPREHPRRSRDPGSSARQPDRPRLPGRSDGLRRARRAARAHPSRRHPLRRARHAGAVAAGARDPQRPAVRVSGRCAARGAADAGGADAPRDGAGRRPATSARSTPTPSRACATKPRPIRATPTSCTTRC